MPDPGRTANADTAAVRSPAAAFRVRMAIGSAEVTPGVPDQVSQARDGTRAPVKDTGCPAAGAAKARWSAGSAVTAEVFSSASPAVSPDSSPTSRVISTTTAPIRANRPLANRRSLHATNMPRPCRPDPVRGIAPRHASPGPKVGRADRRETHRAEPKGRRPADPEEDRAG